MIAGCDKSPSLRELRLQCAQIFFNSQHFYHLLVWYCHKNHTLYLFSPPLAIPFILFYTVLLFEVLIFLTASVTQGTRNCIGRDQVDGWSVISTRCTYFNVYLLSCAPWYWPCSCPHLIVD